MDRTHFLSAEKSKPKCNIMSGATLLGDSINLNISPPSRKRSSSFKKPKEKNLDIFFNDEIRPRTCSMPTRSNIRKPQAHLLRRDFLKLNVDSQEDSYTVREFQMSPKGVIVKRKDSRRSRSSNSVHSSESELYPLSPVSLTSSSVSGESIGTSPSSALPIPSTPIKILVLGNYAVGKTAITQQFMTSEYLGGFNTSVGEYTVICNNHNNLSFSKIYLVSRSVKLESYIKLLCCKH